VAYSLFIAVIDFEKHNRLLCLRLRWIPVFSSGKLPLDQNFLSIHSSCLRQPPFDPNQPPPLCPPWSSHEGMWNEGRDQGSWSGGPPREGGPWSGPGSSDQGPPSWNSQYDQQPPWGSQQDQPPPWGQREPPFPPRMQACPGSTCSISMHSRATRKSFRIMTCICIYSRHPKTCYGAMLRYAKCATAVVLRQCDLPHYTCCLCVFC